MSPEAVPLRRSSRAPPSKSGPAPKPPAPKAAAKPPSKVKPTPKATKKRAASPERAPSPPPKRSKKATSPENIDPAEPVAHAADKKSKKKEITVIPQSKPYFNALPTPPEKKRPGLQVFAWGAGNFGQFGMGPDFLGEFDKPKKHAWVAEQIEEGAFGPDKAGIETVAAGGMHTVFIDEKGTVWTCGVNDDAALGRVTEGVSDPEGTLTSIPHPIESLVKENFRAVQVATGDSICVALDTNGDIRLWGSFRADEGSLGFSESARHQFVPVPVSMDLIHKPGDYEKFSAVATGANHVLALTTHGHIFSWGSGQQSQLGRKVLERHQMKGTNPQRVILGTRSLRAVVIGAGIYHSFAVDEKGTVWGWGLNSLGQAGTGLDGPEDETVPLPKRVIGLSKEELDGATVVQISGGNHHTLFLTSDGKVYACGRANSSQLGLAPDHPAWEGDLKKEFISEPALIAFPDDDEDEDDPVVYVAAGLHSNMAITKAGALFCWGQGVQGELGVPDLEVPTPKMIVRREGGSWTAEKVSCGGQHTMGLFRSKK